MKAWKLLAVSAIMQIVILFANRMRIEHGRATHDLTRR